MFPPSTVVTSAVVLSASACARNACATSSAVTSRPSRCRSRSSSRRHRAPWRQAWLRPAACPYIPAHMRRLAQADLHPEGSAYYTGRRTAAQFASVPRADGHALRVAERETPAWLGSLGRWRSAAGTRLTIAAPPRPLALQSARRDTIHVRPLDRCSCAGSAAPVVGMHRIDEHRHRRRE
jgi:hypothetical protein